MCCNFTFTLITLQFIIWHLHALKVYVSLGCLLFLIYCYTDYMDWWFMLLINTQSCCLLYFNHILHTAIWHLHVRTFSVYSVFCLHCMITFVTDWLNYFSHSCIFLYHYFPPIFLGITLLSDCYWIRNYAGYCRQVYP